MRPVHTQLMLLCVFAGSSVAADTPDCPVITDAARAKVAGYVHKKYNLPDSSRVVVKELSLVEGTCYRKLQFTAEGPTPPLRVELYASPDLRFLTRKLLDSTVEPPPEARPLLRAPAPDLTKGAAASLGPKDAPVTLVVFSDFECPFCSQMAAGLRREILPEDGDKIRLVFRNFPLPMHPWARAAAEAAACVRAQNEQYFWPLHDFIFAHQHEFTTGYLTNKIAEQAAALPGFDSARFKACVDQRETAATVDQDIALGRQVKVTATPTLLVNGVRITGYRAEQIRTLVREQIAAKSAAK